MQVFIKHVSQKNDADPDAKKSRKSGHIFEKIGQHLLREKRTHFFNF